MIPFPFSTPAPTPSPVPEAGTDPATFWVVGIIVVVVFAGMVLRVLLRNRLGK